MLLSKMAEVVMERNSICADVHAEQSAHYAEVLSHRETARVVGVFQEMQLYPVASLMAAQTLAFIGFGRGLFSVVATAETDMSGKNTEDEELPSAKNGKTALRHLRVGR